MVGLEYKELREVVRVLERKLGLISDSGFSCCGVSFAQCHALVEIGRAKNITLIDLSRLLGLDNSTMSRTVDGLVDKGLAKRKPAHDDRRYIYITLSERGNQLFVNIEENMERYYKNILDNIPEDKRQQVIEALQLLNAAIREECCKSIEV